MTNTISQNTGEDLLRAIQDLTNAIGGTGRDLGSYSGRIREAEESTAGLTEEQRRQVSEEQDRRRAQAQAQAEDRQIERRNQQVMYATQRAFESLKAAVMSNEASFIKYNSTLDGSKGIIDAFTANMGLAGKAMGFIAKGALSLAQLQFKQADNALKATDSLAKMGSAGQISGKDILDMGRKAGYASDRLENLIKPIQGMGSAIMSIGDTAAHGQKAFLKIADVGEDARRKFRAMGISQEELTQSQADYIKLQAVSGNRINQPIEKLRAASLEYVENLTTLSALSGKDIETVKKEQQAAQSEIETMIYNNLTDQKIARLKESGFKKDKEEAERLEKQKKVMSDALGAIGTVIGDPTKTKGLASFFATGAVNEFSTQLVNMGVPLDKFRERMLKGEDITADLMDAMREAGNATVRHVGYSAMLDEQTQKEFGITKEFLEWLSKNPGKVTKEQLEAIKAEQRALAEKGDPLQEARNAQLETELKLKNAMDELVQSTSALVNGFTPLTSAVALLQGAVIATTAAMGVQGLLGVLKKAGITGATPAARVLPTLGRALTGVATGVAAGTTATFLAGAAIAAGVGIAAIKGTEYVANKRLDKDIAAKEAAIQQDANSRYNEALKGTGYTYDLSKGGLQKDNKRVPLTEAPDDIKAIVKRVADERAKERMNAPKMAVGGLLGTDQVGMVGEAGPEFITGPAKVVGVNETQKLLRAALGNGMGPFTSLGKPAGVKANEALLGNGMGPFTSLGKPAGVKANEALLERNIRDLNNQKEKELENLTDSNESTETLNKQTDTLSDTFKMFQDQLKQIFGTTDAVETDFTTPEAQGRTGGGNWLSNLFGGGHVDPATKQKAMQSKEGKEALDFFIKQGWSKEQAAGIVGNLMVESGANLQHTAVGDRGKAYGIAQWHPDRQALFKKKFGKDIRESSLQEQLQFVQYELKNNEYEAGDKLSQAKTAEEAAAITDELYERSSREARGKRVDLASALYDVDVANKIGAEAAPEKSPTTPTVPTTAVAQGASIDQGQLMAMNAQAFDTFSEKLSTMISKLEENNELLSKVKQNTG